MSLSGVYEKAQEAVAIIWVRMHEVWIKVVLVYNHAGAAVHFHVFLALERDLMHVSQTYCEQIRDILPVSLWNVAAPLKVQSSFRTGAIETYWSKDHNSVLVVAPYVGVTEVEWVLGILYAYASARCERYSPLGTIAEAMTLATVARLAELLDKNHGDNQYTRGVKTKYGI
jgi:hypothetical protein